MGNEPYRVFYFMGDTTLQNITIKTLCTIAKHHLT